MTGSGRGEDSVGEDSISKDSMSEDPVGEDPVGKDPAGKDPAAEDPAAEDPAAEDPAAEDPAAEATQQAPSAEDEELPEEPETSEDEDAPATRQNGSKKGLLIGLGSGALVGIIAGLAFAGLVKPAFLVGPGKPDQKASEATAALAGKNADAMAKASCRGPDGQLSQQLPAQALQLVQSVKPTGPPHLSLDTEATEPVDVTVSSQGQTQTIPIDIMLGVTNGEWCMTGIAQRQQ
jgi:hypothetical protein